MDTAEPIPRRSRLAERLVVFALGLAVLVGSQLPAVWAWRAQARGYYPDVVFTGALHSYADDASSYLAWMGQVREGRLTLTDRFTHEEHPRDYVNVLFYALGTISRVTGAPVALVYTIARPAMGAVLLLLLYLLAARLFQGSVPRVVCFFFLVLSSGWEGPLTLVGPWVGIGHVASLAWWSPEVSTVFSLVLFPHFVTALTAIVATILLLTAAWSEEERSDGSRIGCALAAGLLLFLLTFFHPYDVVPLVATSVLAPFLFAWLRGGTLARDLRLSAIAFAVCLPALLYNCLLFRRNPAMRAWDLQNVLISPGMLGLVVGLGVGLPLAVLSGLALKRMSRPQLVLSAWLLAILVSIYLPVRFQRKMLAGVQFPLAGLAAVAIFLVILPALARGRRRAPAWAAVALALVLVPAHVSTPFYVWRNEWTRLRRLEYPCWLPAPLMAALRSLEAAPGREAVVVSSYSTGNFIPYYTGKRCLVGHYALTMEARAREADMARFFHEDRADDPWRLASLERWRARYLIHGPYERALGTFDPSSRPWLRLLERDGEGGAADTAVYEVVPLGELTALPSSPGA